MTEIAPKAKVGKGCGCLTFLVLIGVLFGIIYAVSGGGGSSSHPAAVSTAGLTPLQALKAELNANLGKSNLSGYSGPRIIKMPVVAHILDVPWVINDNLVQSLRSDGAKQDVFNMLKIIRSDESVLSTVKGVEFVGYFPEQDKLGNSSLRRVVDVYYSTKRVNAINFQGLLFDEVYGAASYNYSESSWH